ncbi:magnesium transporter [Pigmentiphaga litoralis]|jgi:magnesium and cobalt transporter|uniref:HlyC/CorC family transporter n=1 Tax=Pigmentiphaga litoralis TaxID=516702 RepID=UPI001676418A|nr:transporter associated domain-containing protein [Pigmentiphaga litoralis]GGX13471.1 magnesium transporter [Pigmentiphaga litoralis]
MSDSSPSPAYAARAPKHPPKTFFERLSALIHREPEDREDLKAVLEAAYGRDLLDAEALSMIEGVLAVSELAAGDIMIPRSRMDMLEVSEPIEALLPGVIETAHSRFPVYEESRDNVIGILLAKDLLRCVVDRHLELRTLLRPAVFIPESKKLNVLLREFRSNRNHIAIVVDEHGGTAGLITIEDVLEQIVGEIEDEYDDIDVEQSILPDGKNRWRVMATTSIRRFNETFGSSLDDDEYDTVGGWMAGNLGRIPRRGDHIERDNLKLDVIRADARRALWLRVARLPNDGSESTPIDER